MSPIHLSLIGISHLGRFVTSLFPSNSQLSFNLFTLRWICSSMAHLFFCTTTDLWFKYLSFSPGRYRELCLPPLPSHLWPFPCPAETSQVLLVDLHRNDSTFPLISAPITCPSSQFNLCFSTWMMDLYTGFPDEVSDLVQQSVSIALGMAFLTFFINSHHLASEHREWGAWWLQDAITHFQLLLDYGWVFFLN